MSYGTIKVNTITFTNNGVDQSVTVSGIVASTSGNLTVTGTVSGSTASFANGTFNTFSGGTCTITSGVLASGTASNPAISFNGDVNTGIYSPNADEIGFTTNGQARFIIDANGQLEASSAGSASSPTYTFANDVDTGLYSPGTNQLALSAGGVEKVKLSNSEVVFNDGGGNVDFRVEGDTSANLLFVDASTDRAGIRTNTPEQPLDMRGGAFANNQNFGFQIGTPNGEWKARFSIKSDSSGVSRTAIDALSDSLGGTIEAISVRSNGNVGIGTSSPSTRLAIVGKSVDGVIAQFRPSLSDISDIARIELLGNNSTGTASQQVFFDAYQPSGGTGTDAALDIRVRKGGDSFNSPSTTMTLLGSGRVGIGTTSPQARLEIGNIPSSGITELFTIDRSDSLQLFSAGYDFTNNEVSFSGNNKIFVVKNLTGSTESLRIDTNGRLLVGTSTSRSMAGYGSSLQLEGATSYQSASASIIHNRADNGGPEFRFAKSRGTAQGSVSIVASGDILGRIMFYGADGSVMTQAANISVEVDGTPGANDMPGRLVFSTTADGASSPTERMRISANGQLDTFSTGAAYAFRTGSAASAASVFLLGLHSATQNYTTGTSCFVVRTNGNVENTNNSYIGISDVKLKEHIVDASSQWDDIKALQVRNYNFKPETGHQTHTQIGLIAQEVELVSPGLVSESPDRDEDGNDLGTVTKSVNYSVLYMKAVKALQEAMERIETLEQRLNDAGIN